MNGGDEFYFEIPVRMQLDETATTRVAISDIGYWPPGNGLALFFGPSPAGNPPDDIYLACGHRFSAPAHDATILRKARGARSIRLERY